MTVVFVRTIVRAAREWTPSRPYEGENNIDIVAVARVAFGIDDLEIDIGAESEAASAAVGSR